ncbi:MAG: G5 domain-containing protein [Bacillota bacterium]|nr:G5 domain-containing protein [Bacillota bacterium]
MTTSPCEKRERASVLIERKREIALVVCVAVLLTTGLVGAAREVKVIVDDEVISVATSALRVSDILNQAGVELSEGDELTPGLQERVYGSAVITVRRAVPVEVVVDGRTFEVRSTGPMVKHVLAQVGVLLRPDDRVSPGMDVGLTLGMRIRVVRVTSEVVTRQVRVAYRIEKRPDPNMDRGKTKVLRPGVEGLREQKVLVTYEDGRPVKEKVLSSKVLREPVSKLLAVGTRNPVRTLHTSRGTFRYRNCYTMLATAYEPGPRSCGKSADGYTAIGMKAEPGVVAVDPRVIPLRTRLYVEGYGPAIAADVGGAIKGNRIDLLFSTVEEALRYGKRWVKVYVLEP